MALITALANDGMEGRDTGSPAYERAAHYVAAEFEKSGLKPAGEKGYFQSVPMRRVQLNVSSSTVALERKTGARKLAWLREITMTAAPGLPSQIDAPLVFRGSAPGPPAGLNVTGKIVVRLSPPVGTPAANVPAPPLPAGAIGTLGIDNFDGPERRRWPAAYAVNVTIAGTPPPTNPVPALFLNPTVAEELFRASGHTYAELKRLYDAGQPLPWFQIPATVRATLRFDSSDISSHNILAVLPGSDPALKNEYVVISATWTAMASANPSMATASTMARLTTPLTSPRCSISPPSGNPRVQSFAAPFFRRLHRGRERPAGLALFRRPPHRPQERIVADINLDQLRPLFP